MRFLKRMFFESKMQINCIVLSKKDDENGMVPRKQTIHLWKKQESNVPVNRCKMKMYQSWSALHSASEECTVPSCLQGLFARFVCSFEILEEILLKFTPLDQSQLVFRCWLCLDSSPARIYRGAVDSSQLKQIMFYSGTAEEHGPYVETDVPFPHVCQHIPLVNQQVDQLTSWLTSQLINKLTSRWVNLSELLSGVTSKPCQDLSPLVAQDCNLSWQ